MRLSSKGPLVLALVATMLGCGGAPSVVPADSGVDTGAAVGGADAPAADGADAPVTDGADAPEADGLVDEVDETRPPDELVAKACAGVAKAWCGERAACSGKFITAGVDVVKMFGTMSECLVRQQLQCLDVFGATGSGHSLATEDQCARDLTSYSCADFYANDTPASCRPPGASVDGAACTLDAQCLSGFCAGARDAQCGTCAPEPVVAARCTDVVDCGHGQICDQMTKTCVPPRASGAECMGTSQGDSCGYGLTCDVHPANMHLGVCVVAAGPGAACNSPDMSGCDVVQGVFCGASCAAMTFVGDGAPCGYFFGGNKFVGCTAGGCYTATGLADPSGAGTCKANAADRMPCDPVTGPGCEYPAVCVPGAGTSGLCRLPDGACH